jgi:NIPSNAP
MERRTMLQGIGAGAVIAAMGGTEAISQTTATTVFELRTYHASEGKLDALLARFRDHTITIFKRHGLELIGFWTPTDDPLKGKTLIYILKHPSREVATANWAAFHDDPEWKSVSAASEVNGKLTTSVDSVYMKLTDFSPKI